MKLKIKEGFEGERMYSLPENKLASYLDNPLISNLYIRKIGYFPKAKYHFIEKKYGTDYFLLIHCTGGRGWYRINNKIYTIEKDQFIILPKETPYSFGSDETDPWSIYWIHFKGSMSYKFKMQDMAPQDLSTDKNQRTQFRLDIFEEIFSRFSMAYISEYMQYCSMCLYLYLSSFCMKEQFCFVDHPKMKDMNLSRQAIEYMKENMHKTLSLKEIASRFKYSPSHFSHIFMKETGTSPIEYFIHLKIQKACLYLETSRLKIKDISCMLGYEEVSYFSRLFTKMMGTSPSTYRKKERN